MCKGMSCKVRVELLLIDCNAVKRDAANVSKFLQVHIVAVIAVNRDKAASQLPVWMVLCSSISSATIGKIGTS